MSVERSIDSTIKTTLVSNDDFSYAHLVKFERPFKQIGRDIDTGTGRYAYYTDGATDILFDDGNGMQTYRANRLIGLGNYSETTKARATSMSLTIAAEDLGTTIEIAGTLSTSGLFTPTSTVVNGDVINFAEEGFKEGDLVKFTNGSTVDKFIILSFPSESTIQLLVTGSDTQDSSFPGSNTTATFTIQQDSIELNAALMERGITSSSTANASPTFVNREVFVHKVFIDTETGLRLGGNTKSILIFKGIIASVNIDESPTSSRVKWNLTSHWGDFEEINGRLTSDEVHRSLDSNKLPQIDSVLRPEYAADLGFQHSETSLNAIATYKTQETRYRMKEKRRGGIAGLLGLKKQTQQEYQVDVQNEVDLNVHLQGRYLPVVYGVQRVNGNPIFADTLNDNNKIVFTADAICEGEIHGLFNMYIDDVPLICTDDNDFDVRNVQSGTDKDNTQLQCFGKMSRGNTLSGQVYSGTEELSDQVEIFDNESEKQNYVNIDDTPGIPKEMPNYIFSDLYGDNSALFPGGASGLEHSATYNIDHPYTIEQQFMHGRPNQLASAMLVGPAEASDRVGSVSVTGKGFSYETTPTVTFSAPSSGVRATGTAVMGSSSTDDANKVRSIRVTNGGSGYTSAPSITFSGGGGSGARATSNLGGYKRQTDYWSGNLPYWSPNHRLLDTAYAATKFTIDADSTSIPEIEYVVKGKVLDCYNYDNTYRHNTGEATTGTGDDHANFKEGDLVIVQTWNGSTYVDDNSGINSNKFKIMDKWLFTTSRGSSHYRFRLDTTPNLGLVDGVPATTKLRLKHVSTGKLWHMLTWNHEIIGSTTFPDNWVAAGASSNITSPSGVLTISGISAANKTKLGATNPVIQFYAPEWYTSTPGNYADLKYAILRGTWTGSGDANILTFANTTNFSGTFPTTIKLRNATVFDCSSISAIASISTNATLTNSYTDTFSNTVFERGGTLHNITTGESREITAFNNTTNILELETPFLTPPYSDHKFKIDNTGGDKRSLSNPALQTLDFITNAKYGRGLELSELDLQSFINSAKLCDARSDITIKLANSPSGVAVGDVFEITEDGNVGQGHVASGTVAVGGIDIPNKTVTLTNVINKFAKKYSTYCTLKKGDIVYTEAGNFFRASADTGVLGSTVPTSTTGNLTLITGDIQIHRTSGTGTTSPLNMKKVSLPINYSLYDSDWVKYWRYFGWEEHHQREVTRHQTNFILDTGKSVFANINALLSHYNGILSYENGKYVLSVETREAAPTISLNSSQENINPYYIDNTDVIGKISVVDNSQKNGKNTIKASLADPQLNFSTRSVTFFNSDFLKADRNVPKTGSFPFTGITNYYNARINTEKELFHSRFSKEVSFELGPRGILLRAGQVLSMNYEPFGWTNKLLRIENLSFRANCNVSVKCREYDDSVYEITQQQALGVSQQTSAQFSLQKPDKPTLSSVTNNKTGSMLLTWANASDFIEGSDSTEIYCADSDSLAAATLLATVDNSTTYMYNAAAAETKYFWIRHSRFSRGSTGNNNYTVKGEYNASSGTQGVSLAISAGAQTVKLLPSSHVVDYSKVGTETSTIQFSTIPFNISGVHFYEFFVNGSAVGSSLSSGSRGTINGIANVAYNAFVLPQASEPGPDDAPVQVTVKIRAGASNGTVITQDTVSIFAVQDGQSAITGFLTNESHTAASASDGTGSNLSTAGGTFKVFYGNTDITTNAKVTFSAATGTNITGTIDAGGDGASGSGVYTLSSFTNSATSGSVVFSAVVKGSLIGGTDGGNDVTISKTYSIAKAKAGLNGSGSGGDNAKIVTLTASDYSIVYDKDGATPNPSTSTDITLTATAVNFSDPFFKFTGDGITDEGTYTNGTEGDKQDEFTFQVPTSFFSDPKTIRVGVAESSDDDAEIAFDSVSLFAVKPGDDGTDGDDGYTVICTNEAHTFPAANNGAISGSNFAGSGTDIEVFQGATQLTAITSGTPSSGQFKVTAAATGITAGSLSIIDSDSGVVGSIIRVGNHTGMAAATAVASIIYSINIENTTTVTKKQTFTKSKEGIAGANAKITVVTASSPIMTLISRPEASSENNFSPLEIELKAQNVNTTTNGVWSRTGGGAISSVVNDHTNASCKVTSANFADNMKVTYTLNSADGGASDSVTLQLLSELGDPINVILSNEAHVLPASASGVVSNYSGSGTTIKAFQGADLLDFDGTGTAAGHYKVEVANLAGITEGGITASSASGNNRHAVVANHSGVSSGTDVYQLVYTITGKNANGTTFVITKTQSITKSKTGDEGGTGQSSKTVEVFKKNDSTLGFAAGNNATNQNFSSPTTGLETGWSTTQPAITADGDEIYKASRTFTSDGLSPQGSAWSTPVIVAQREDGDDAQNQRQPSIFRKNSSTISASSGNFTNPLTGNTDWSFSVPAITTNGDEVYVSTRIFTSDGASPQQSSWSTPALYARRVDGSTITGQGVRQANLYKKNDTSLTSTTAGNFANPLTGNTDWSFAVPALTANNDKVYVATRTFTSNGASPQDSAWSTPVIYAQRTDGDDGDDGAASQTVFYRKSGSGRWTPPSAPSGTITATSIVNQWGTVFVAPDTSNVLWQSFGNKPSGGSFTWSAPILFIDKDRITDLFEFNYNWDFDSNNLGFLGLTDSDYTNSSVTLPTFTTASGAPNNSTTPVPNPKNSIYLQTGVTPNVQWVSNGSTWVSQGTNSDTQNVEPTFTSSTSAPSNSTTPVPNPKGSSWLHTTPDPSVLYLSNGSTWTALDVNKDTVFDGAYGSLSGTPSIPSTIDDLTDIPSNPGSGKFLKWSGSAFQWADDNNTVFTLPDTIPTGITFSSGTLSIARGAGTVNLTIPDTNTTYGASDFNITQLGGYSAANYLNSQNSIPTASSGSTLPTASGLVPGESFLKDDGVLYIATAADTWVEAANSTGDTTTQVRQDNTGTYRTGNINLVSGTNMNITETSAGVFNFASTDTNTQLSDSEVTTMITNSDLNMGSNNITTTGKMLYSNVYSGTGDLPSASTYHGMFAHVHGTGKGYFAHAGAWVELANQSNLTSVTTTANAALPKAGGTMTGALNMGSNNITTTGKMLYSNLYSSTGDLPSASTYHGMFAHVHGTGLGYFAHAGAWVPLANLTGAAFTGNISTTGTVVASGDITAFSDKKLKDNILTLDGSKVFDMRGVSFTRNDLDNKESSGVIAQELEKIAPELVHEDEDGIKGVAYGNVVGYLIEAVKLLKEEIEELKSGTTR